MLTASVILENVAKRYKVYSSPQDRLREIIGLKLSPERTKEVCALEPISLTINRGEFCGVIGRNGAGKSTLLRLIAGQSMPTEGKIRVFGTKSLLQLGVGFDAELTGRANVHNSLRYSLLSPDVPEDLVNQVIEFSELGDFINFPIKTYSSGMYSRLAFATAIVVDPDILIADEVLAVGDINFSQKCLAKMREFKERGKTVVFVTHDLSSVRVFCDRAIFLEHGRLLRDGNPQEVCEEYRNLMLYGVRLESTNLPVRINTDLPAEAANPMPSQSPKEPALAEMVLPKKARRALSADGALGHEWRRARRETLMSAIEAGEVRAVRLRLADRERHIAAVAPGDAVCFDLVFSLRKPFEPESVGLTMHDDRGQIILHLNSSFSDFVFPRRPPDDVYMISFNFIMPYLRSGQYSFCYGVNVWQGPDATLAFKHDFDFSVEVELPNSPKLDRQAGIVLIEDFAVTPLTLASGDIQDEMQCA